MVTGNMKKNNGIIVTYRNVMVPVYTEDQLNLVYPTPIMPPDDPATRVFVKTHFSVTDGLLLVPTRLRRIR